MILILGSISFFDGDIRDRIFKTTIDKFSVSKDSGLPRSSSGKLSTSKKEFYIFTEVHHGHYMSAKLMFRENKLFGIGPNNFEVDCKKKKYFYYKERCATHPHNYYFQLFAELGILAGSFLIIIFLSIVVSLLKSLKKKHINKDSETILLIGFFIMLFPIVPHGNFFNNWLVLMFIFSLSFFLHFSYKEK